MLPRYEDPMRLLILCLIAAAAPGMETATAAPQVVAAQEWLTGTVRPATAATVRARIGGVLERIAVRAGDRVSAGDVLAVLDGRETAARLAQAEAAVRVAEAARGEVAAARAEAAAARTLARLDVERARPLRAREALTQADLDSAEARFAAAEARVAAVEAQAASAEARITAAQAALGEARLLHGYATIPAPFAGVVVERHAEVGDLLAPGAAVVEIEDPASLRLEVAVPESLASRAAPGAVLRARVPAAGLEADAVVAEVIHAVDPASRTVLAKLALPADPALRRGQFGRAALALPGTPTLSVPAAAVVRRGQLDLVFTAADGRARLVLVRTGETVDGRTIIRAGLSAGDTVVVAPPPGLQDGAPLR